MEIKNKFVFAHYGTNSTWNLSTYKKTIYFNIAREKYLKTKKDYLEISHQPLEKSITSSTFSTLFEESWINVQFSASFLLIKI